MKPVHVFQLENSRSAKDKPRMTRGFTLIELMVTLAILAVLMVVAAPSFVQIQRNSQLSDAVNSFVLATSSAKSAALKTGFNTLIVPNDALLGWKSGWSVFVDKNWDNIYDESTDLIVLKREALLDQITVATPGTTALSDGLLAFNASGFPKTRTDTFGNGTLIMSITGRVSNIIVDTAGRVRSCKPSTGCLPNP